MRPVRRYKAAALSGRGPNDRVIISVPARTKILHCHVGRAVVAAVRRRLLALADLTGLAMDMLTFCILSDGRSMWPISSWYMARTL